MKYLHTIAILLATIGISRSRKRSVKRKCAAEPVEPKDYRSIASSTSFSGKLVTNAHCATPTACRKSKIVIDGMSELNGAKMIKCSFRTWIP